MSDAPIAVRVSADMRAVLTQLAKEKGLTLSEYVRDVLCDHIDKAAEVCTS